MFHEVISNRKSRLLIFIVAYNAEKTIASVVRRIPISLSKSYDIEVLIIDDASMDLTFAEGHSVSKAAEMPFPIHVLFNPVNQGYGGNQKLGYQYAIENGFDFVALLHGDGQYAPECLPMLLEPLQKGGAAAVFGSRMLKGLEALRGGMPAYKFVGNRILTWIENQLLHTHLSEFHSGYRVYSVPALTAVPFERNSNGFHFDTEIIIQLLIARLPIVELPIPTYYGDEICHVNGLCYAWNVLAAALKARMQEWSLFYDPRFDCAPPGGAPLYQPKLGYASSHSLAMEYVRPQSRVLDLGCAGGYVASVLRREMHCQVSGVDLEPSAAESVDEFTLHDLNLGVPAFAADRYDAVLMLDVVEHLMRPEAFLEELGRALAVNPSVELLISTGNIGCFITRMMLLIGQFNYGKRGILDLTHVRLFTFASLRRLLEQAGFEVLETRGIPVPYPLAIGHNRLSRILVALNRLLIGLSRGLFAYQIFMRTRPRPSLEALLRAAQQESRVRADLLDAEGVEDLSPIHSPLRADGIESAPYRTSSRYA